MCSARSEWVSCRPDITKNVPLDSHTQIMQGSSLQAMTRTPQLISGHQQLQQMQQQVLVQGQGKSNPLQPGQLWLALPSSHRPRNQQIQYLVDGSPDNCFWQWGTEPGWGHVHPNERGCGE
jgi:hypothetical protein